MVQLLGLWFWSEAFKGMKLQRPRRWMWPSTSGSDARAAPLSCFRKDLTRWGSSARLEKCVAPDTVRV